MILDVFLKWTSLSKTCLNTLHIFRVRTLRIAKFLRIVAGKWVYGSSSSASKGALCNNCSTAAKSLKHFTLWTSWRQIAWCLRTICLWDVYQIFSASIFWSLYFALITVFQNHSKSLTRWQFKAILEQKKIERCKGRVGPSSAQEN